MVRDYIGAIQAKSAHGAVVQLGVAAIEIDMLKGMTPEDAEPHIRMIRRLLYSAGHALDSHLGAKVFDGIAARYLDPWKEYELHIASCMGSTSEVYKPTEQVRAGASRLFFIAEKSRGGHALGPHKR